MSVKVTVLSAVYGIPERILREALDCFVNQTCADAEFILVNDNSPDAYTLNVLREYEARDSRFKVVNNLENKGLAAATNQGLELGQGEYFCRIDPDDLVPDNYLEVMTKVMDFYESDMVTCSIKNFKDGRKIDFQNNISAERYFTLKRPLKKRKMLRQKFICRMFRRSVISDLRFDERLLRGDDLVFIHLYLQKCARCVTIDFPGYFYRHGRIFAPGEQPATGVLKHIPPHFYYEPRLTINAFSGAYNIAHSVDEQRFFAYMMIHRYMRTAFWLRKFDNSMNGAIACQLDEYFCSTVERAAHNIYPVTAVFMRNLFCRRRINTTFFFRIQVLRLFFELRNIDYHVSILCCSIMVDLFHIIGY